MFRDQGEIAALTMVNFAAVTALSAKSDSSAIALTVVEAEMEMGATYRRDWFVGVLPFSV
jgi:hypothetical protein